MAGVALFSAAVLWLLPGEPARARVDTTQALARAPASASPEPTSGR
jgi:hypothetical protein